MVLLLSAFVALVIGVFAYVLIRLATARKSETLDPRAQRAARLLGAPKLFDALLARPMSRREKWGWALFGLFAFVAVFAVNR